MQFERNLEDNIFRLHEDLIAQRYVHEPYYKFHIYDPKHRIISKATVRDRLAHHMIFNELYEVFDQSFIYHSYASRLGKGSHLGVANVARALRKSSLNNTRTVYALKCDIKKFFDSVDHKKLEQIMQNKISDQRLLRLINKIVRSFSKTVDNFAQRERELAEPLKGLPIGNVTSQIFSNIYLNELDQFVKHGLREKHYFRYADDFLIIHEDKKHLEMILERIGSFLNIALRLELHPHKVEIRKYGQGIDFLGYVILPHHIALRAKTKRRMLSKLEEKQEQHSQGRLEDFSYSQSLQSYLGMIEHSDSHDLGMLLRNNFTIIG